MCRCEGYGFQAEDGIRDYYASRGLGDVYKRQLLSRTLPAKCVDILQDVLQGILPALHPNSLDNIVHTTAKGRLNL